MTKYFRTIVVQKPNKENGGKAIYKNIEEDLNVFFVAHKQTLTITCMEYLKNGEPYLLITNEQGQTIEVSEIIAGDSVFTTKGQYRQFKQGGFHELIFRQICDLRVEDVQFISLRSIAKSINEKDDLGSHPSLSTGTVSRICKDFGFPLVRKAEGYGIQVDLKKIQELEARFAS